MFASSGDLAEAFEQVARLGAQLLLQAALEEKVTAFLAGPLRTRHGHRGTPGRVCATEA
jgi:hypothetical protein